MTTSRYRNYRRALRLIGEIADAQAAPEAIQVLRQCNEDLLLGREATPETEELCDRAAIALTFMTAIGAISRAEATTIWIAMCDAGPQPTEAVSEPAAVPLRPAA